MRGRWAKRCSKRPEKEAVCDVSSVYRSPSTICYRERDAFERQTQESEEQGKVICFHVMIDQRYCTIYLAAHGRVAPIQ